MMSSMFGVDTGAASLALLHRPSDTSLAVVVLCALVGWAVHVYVERSTRSPVEFSASDARPAPLGGSATIEPPAVVALLTNGFDVPRSAVTATALDLAARGWVRLTSSDGELVVVTRGGAAAGDSLLPFEQQVFNHLAARAFNDVTSAATLAVSHHRLDRRWWLRFGRSVTETAQHLGLTTPRYSPLELAPPAAVAVVGIVTAVIGARRGAEIAIADSLVSRAVWLLAVVALASLGWVTAQRAVGSAQRPTDTGRRRAGEWMGYRRRLRARIPAHASVLAPPAQQVALAHAAVMGVAAQVLDELPAAPEGHRSAWSEAGGTPHVVRVRYPIRPGYGQHPLKVGGAGLILLLLGRFVQGYLHDIGDGSALGSVLDKVPGQVGLIRDLADVLGVLCWIPIMWALWALVAGAVDSIATRERVGVVVRARRPSEVLPSFLVSIVKPFAERDRFSTYLAVDDGRHRRVTAWLANERSAAPQGAQARVRATPLLGYVRSSEPIGTGAPSTSTSSP